MRVESARSEWVLCGSESFERDPARGQQRERRGELEVLGRYGAIAKEIVVKKTMDTRKPLPAPTTTAKKKKSVRPSSVNTASACYDGETGLAQAEAVTKAPEPPVEEWEEVHIEDLVEEVSTRPAGPGASSC